MKNIIIIFSFLFFAACNRKPINSEIKTIEKDSLIVFDNKYFDHVDFKDNRCLSEYKRALEDIGKNKIVYANFGINHKYNEEFEYLLKLNKIEYEFLGENCTLLSNCYGYCMDSIISKRFGDDFIEKLRTQSMELSNSRWKTKVYNYFEVDTNAKYPNTNDENEVEKLILKKFIMPKNWNSKNMKKNEREFISIEIIIDNKGKARIKSNELFMYNIKPENLKHLPYLKKELIRNINEMEFWNPAILNKHNVNSEEYIDITFN
jgi:hypothetical protein